ncbi:hypothetical protein [Microbulbifer sp. 2205BS26-8]|nr:hypothetical protein [Microbulbifer sp. 2205BS26-8]MDP5211121.1 hypothetical protein [Microbulbifer sp. 2205BS26-8]
MPPLFRQVIHPQSLHDLLERFRWQLNEAYTPFVHINALIKLEMANN